MELEEQRFEFPLPVRHSSHPRPSHASVGMNILVAVYYKRGGIVA